MQLLKQNVWPMNDDNFRMEAMRHIQIEQKAIACNSAAVFKRNSIVDQLAIRNNKLWQEFTDIAGLRMNSLL